MSTSSREPNLSPSQIARRANSDSNNSSPVSNPSLHTAQEHFADAPLSPSVGDNGAASPAEVSPDERDDDSSVNAGRASRVPAEQSPSSAASDSLELPPSGVAASGGAPSAEETTKSVVRDKSADKSASPNGRKKQMQKLEQEARMWKREYQKLKQVLEAERESLARGLIQERESAGRVYEEELRMLREQVAVLKQDKEQRGRVGVVFGGCGGCGVVMSLFRSLLVSAAEVCGILVVCGMICL